MSVRRQLFRILLLLTCGYSLYAGLTWSKQMDIVFPGRHRTPDAHAERQRARGESLQSDRPDRRALLFRATAADAPLVVIAHGNGEIAEDWVPDAVELSQRGAHVLVVEYPGYGGLPGPPTQPAIRAAFEEGLDAALAALAPARPVVVGVGYSLGAAVIADLSRSRPIDAMVLHAPFRSLGHMALRRALPPALVQNPFDTLTAIREFRGRVTVVHGLEDVTIPAAEGRAVAAAAPRGAFIGIPNSGHEAGLEDWAAACDRILEHGKAGFTSQDALR